MMLFSRGLARVYVFLANCQVHGAANLSAEVMPGASGTPHSESVPPLCPADLLEQHVRRWRPTSAEGAFARPSLDRESICA